MKPKLILVGGFLGAGKTTLLWEVAQRLAARGQKVGLITNDQAPELVDTTLLSRGEAQVAEVSGSCFCCNFPGLLGAMAELRQGSQVDVFVAEPVGSCTDLSATIVQPFKAHHAADLTIAPLSVVVDPTRLQDILKGGDGGLHPSAAYIFRKQMEEADILVINKSDLLDGEALETLKEMAVRQYPLATLSVVSAKTGFGIDAWVDAVVSAEQSGAHLAEVDYDTYAEGEAVLGWLNARFELSSGLTDWRKFLGNLMTALSRAFESDGASVGHVKVLLESGEHFVIGNLTGTGSAVELRGDSPLGRSASLTVNARVETTPKRLEEIVQRAIEESSSGIHFERLAWRCLSPGRPMPSFRFDHLVSIT